MDSVGMELWEAKREQHRDIRKLLYNQCLGALNAKGILQGGATIEQLYIVAQEYNGKLVLQWRQFFNDYWRRKLPTAPSQEAEVAKIEIHTIIDNEEKLINQEIQNILQKLDIIFNEVNLKPGRIRLHQSCEVLKKGCIAEIETLNRVQEATLGKAQDEKKQGLLRFVWVNSEQLLSSLRR